MNEELKKILEEWGDDVVIAMGAVLTAERSVATGRLRQSLKYIINDDGIQFLMEDYGKFVDEGTKPGRKAPPIAPLKQWVKLKGMPPGAAYAIQKKIAKKGTRPKRFFNTVIEKEIVNLLPHLEEGFVRYIEGRIKILNENNNP